MWFRTTTCTPIFRHFGTATSLYQNRKDRAEKTAFWLADLLLFSFFKSGAYDVVWFADLLRTKHRGFPEPIGGDLSPSLLWKVLGNQTRPVGGSIVCG